MLRYGAVLERQELQLAYRDGAFVARYYEDVLPIAPDSFSEVLEPELEDWLITEAVRCAKRRAAVATPFVFDFVERLLLKQTPSTLAEDCEEQARFIRKLQQITSPIAAKGIEDTAFYVYNRLLSLNEVGADPRRFGMASADVHAWLVDRRRRWPSALSATATHDTKRGEDVRARLNVLSEIPGAWKSALAKWRTLNRRHKRDVRGTPAPDANEEYLLYQTLVGAWPFDQDIAAFRERVRTYVVKALGEAKVHTGWFGPDEEYEEGVLGFVDAILDTRRPNPFLQAFQPFQARVAELWIYNSLAQLLIKIAAPGVPDFYQGTELWDLTLVDPDNRRPVDYARLRQALARLKNHATPEELLAGRADGAIKLFVMTRAPRRRRDSDRLRPSARGVAGARCGAAADRHCRLGRYPDRAAGVCRGGERAMLSRRVTSASVGVADGTIAASQIFDCFPLALLTT